MEDAKYFFRFLSIFFPQQTAEAAGREVWGWDEHGREVGLVKMTLAGVSARSFFKLEKKSELEKVE